MQRDLRLCQSRRVPVESRCWTPEVWVGCPLLLAHRFVQCPCITPHTLLLPPRHTEELRRAKDTKCEALDLRAKEEAALSRNTELQHQLEAREVATAAREEAVAGREAALEAQEASVKAREEQVGCNRTYARDKLRSCCPSRVVDWACLCRRADNCC